MAAPLGTRIDRSTSVRLTFNGAQYEAFQGDTLASALLAHGLRVVARSFKYHRPRGIFSAGIEEPSALVDVGAGSVYTPNVSASVLEVFDGLEARSVNAWPSVRFDLHAVNNWVSAVLPAAFYYKTFMWPNWHRYEPMIRRIAGLGRAPAERDSDRYEESSITADLLVVGGGVAGLATAAAAARAGAQVILVTQAPTLGGVLGYRNNESVRSLIEAVQALPIRILSRTIAFGIYDHNLVCAREMSKQATKNALPGPGERLWKIRARKVAFATGAIERPMLFPNNDRPGVLLAGAAYKFAYAHGVLSGRRAVIVVNADSAYRIASQLRDVGMDIAAIVDRRSRASIHVGAELMEHVLDNAHVTSVSGSFGVRGCRVATRSGVKRIDCDVILSAGGYAPAVHLHSQAGGKLQWNVNSAMFVPAGSPLHTASVGACAGLFDPRIVVEHANQVGRALATGSPLPAVPADSFGTSLPNTYVPGTRGKHFVDLQNDVTAADVALAARENYRSVEHLKRYTTLGMGTDQGKTSNVNGLVLMAAATDRSPEEAGTTRFRPPYAPITLGTLRGRRIGDFYRPVKHLPAESWHKERGGTFEEYGGWSRPTAYPQADESVESAALREARQVRTSAGLFDGSPLGKLEVFGPDAARFLDLMYVGTMSNLAIGQARYGLLLSENGVVVDDGIVARMDENLYWVNTTSGGAERTAAAFDEWLQCEFTTMRVAVTNVTSRWMNVTVAGPRAWSWLEAAGLPKDLAPLRFKHMSFARANFEGLPLRAMRASFSGELGYELNVPVHDGRHVLDRIWSHAPQFEAGAYGVEALQILRVEKGYIHIGTDTDGTTLPGDIGFARAIKTKKSDFVGRRSLSLPFAQDNRRLQLVGLEPRDGRTLLPVGAHISSSPPPSSSDGHVTSSVMSVVLDRPIALGMLANGSARIGEEVSVYHLDRSFRARVVSFAFVDPKGSRLNG
jgi:sarcosine oxidase, subunit alpha